MSSPEESIYGTRNRNAIQETLAALFLGPGSFTRVYDRWTADGQLKPYRPTSEQVFRKRLSRLKNQGLVTNKNRVWEITTAGKEFLASKVPALRRFFPTRKKAVARGMILMFDIPETRRKYRDWLRIELAGFGFDQIQRSVWFGPPLPKEFILYLKEIKLTPHIRFFRVSEQDII